ncbi:MAG TPA: Tim44 domain-containing protein, partial [Geobacteraceae bacterium]
MYKYLTRLFTVVAVTLFLSASLLDTAAHARAGGGRSSGSRGSRTYSTPASPYSQPSPQYAPQSNPN